MFLRLSLFFLSACGVISPKQKDPPSTASDPVLASADTACGAIALESFSTQVEPSIDSTCASCHESGIGAPTLYLKKSDPSHNREKLFNYVQLNDSKIESKFKGSHSGGDLSAVLSKTKVAAWIAKEKDCQ